MIASHDSFTYLEPKHGFWNLFAKFWRCQDMTVQEQYGLGVRYFDVRVCRHETADFDEEWVLCHGLVDLKKSFSSLRDLCDYFETVLKGSYYRIVLEKGNDDDVDIFKEEMANLAGAYNGLVWIVVKKPWESLYVKNGHPKVIDCTFKAWNIKNLFNLIFRKPIKAHSQKANAFMEDEHRDDKDTVYFLDYATDVL